MIDTVKHQEHRSPTDTTVIMMITDPIDLLNGIGFVGVRDVTVLADSV